MFMYYIYIFVFFCFSFTNAMNMFFKLTYVFVSEMLFSALLLVLGVCLVPSYSTPSGRHILHSGHVYNFI